MVNTERSATRGAAKCKDFRLERQFGFPQLINLRLGAELAENVKET